MDHLHRLDGECLIDVGYILGHQDQYEELRYSLRSLSLFTPGVDNVWVAGAPPPDWSTGILHLPVEQAYVEPDMAKRDNDWWYNRKSNMRRNLLVLCEAIPGHFLYMNDDFMLVAETDCSPLPTRGTLADFAAGDIGDPRQNNGPLPDTWRLLREKGVADPLFISEHIPLLVRGSDLAPMMRDAWDIPGFSYSCLWGNLADVETETFDKTDGDRLLVKEHLHYDSWPDHWWSASTVHRSFFDWPVGQRLRAMFPSPSRWEND